MTGHPQKAIAMRSLKQCIRIVCGVAIGVCSLGVHAYVFSLKSSDEDGFQRKVSSSMIREAMGNDREERQENPLELDDLLQVTEVPRYGLIGSFSPDGRLLAISTRKGRPVKFGSEWFTSSGVEVTFAGRVLTVIDVETGKHSVVDPQSADHGITSWGGAWSPDGARLAFYSDRDGAERVWVWDRGTKQIRRVSDAIVRMNPADRQTPVWTPDGRQIVTTILPAGMTVAEANARPDAGHPRRRDRSAAAPGATVTVYADDASVQTEPVRGSGGTDAGTAASADEFEPEASSTIRSVDLAVIDVNTGAIRRLEINIVPGGVWMSPAASRIAYVRYAGWHPAMQQRYVDLMVSDLDGDVPRVIVPRIPQAGAAASWSPDGQWLAYTKTGPVAAGDVNIVSAGGGVPKHLTAGTHQRFDRSPPLWTKDGRALVLIGDGRLWRVPVDGTQAVALTPQNWERRVVRPIPSQTGNIACSLVDDTSVVVSFVEIATGRAGFARVDARSGKSEVLLTESKVHDTFPICTEAHRALAYVAEDPEHAPDVWLVSSGGRTVRQLTHLNPQLDRYKFGTTRIVTYRKHQGEELRGLLTVPPTYASGRRVPLVVIVYPSILDKWRSRFRGPLGDYLGLVQLLATRGYAVLEPEIPTRTGTPMQDTADAVLAAIDASVSVGIADPDRVGVFGHSYGGFGVLAMLVQSSRFKAGVMEAGFGDYMAFYGKLGTGGQLWGAQWAENAQGRMGGTPWQFRDRYIENSPVWFLDRVHTPLLILAGEDDKNVPVWLADALYVGLHRLSKPVEYRRYANESHVVGYGNLDNRRDKFNAILRWFETHLTIEAIAR